MLNTAPCSWTFKKKYLKKHLKKVEKKKKEVNRFNPKTTTSITDLPHHILTDILSRVPAKTILACRCVCKSWLYLTSNNNDSYFFASLHFSRSPIELLVRPINSCHRVSSWSMSINVVDDLGFAPFNSYPPFSSYDIKHIFDLSELYQQQQPHDDEGGYSILGSSNGLLCLCNTSYYDASIVCNPVTGEYVVLPKPKVDLNVAKVIVSVFGFSPTSNQYKLLRTLLVTNGAFECYRMAEILVVGSDSWRRIGCAPLSLSVSSTLYACFLNGIVHWACDDDETLDFIISFDFESERFGKILPPFLFGENHKKDKWKMNIGVLEGCLFVCDVTPLDHLDIWVMKEYGLQESWSIYFVVDTTGVPVLHHGEYRPIKFLSNGEMLMIMYNYLVFYDPLKKKFRYLHFLGKMPELQTIFHTLSLVSLKDVVMGDNLRVLNMKSRMSSSSTYCNNPGEFGELRYQNKNCKCGQRCAVKITESNKKNNKGRLYYVCPDGGCKFWSWCNPLSLSQISTSATSQANHRNIERPEQGTEGGRRHDPLLELKSQFGAISAQLVSSTQNNMHMLIQGCLVISLLSIVIGMAVALLFK